MSAPRPYETYPFHPPALFTSYNINQSQYICKTVTDISSMWCLYYVFKDCKFVIYARALPKRLVSRFQRHFEVILSSMWYVLVGDTARQCH